MVPEDSYHCGISFLFYFQTSQPNGPCCFPYSLWGTRGVQMLDWVGFRPNLTRIDRFRNFWAARFDSLNCLRTLFQIFDRVGQVGQIEKTNVG